MNRIRKPLLISLSVVALRRIVSLGFDELDGLMEGVALSKGLGLLGSVLGPISSSSICISDVQKHPASLRVVLL